MPGLKREARLRAYVPGIHVFFSSSLKDVDGRTSPAMTMNYVLPHCVKIALTTNAAPAANQIAARPSQ
jgi:hypothetical protein